MKKGGSLMRIEINSGGLSTGCTLGLLHEDLEHSIQRTERLLDALTALRRYTYTVNGGVGSLQNALNDINSSIVREEQHLSNMNDADRRVEQFVVYTRQTDQRVAQAVNRNKELFYRVNPWAKPRPTGKPGVSFGNIPLLDRLLSRFRDPHAHSSGGGHHRNPAAIFGFGAAGALGGTGLGYAASGGLYGPRTEYKDGETTKSLYSGNAEGFVGKNGTGVGVGAYMYGPKATWGNGKASASVSSFGVNGKVTVGGYEVGSAKADVDYLGVSAEGKAGAKIKFDDDTGKLKDAFIGAGGEAKAHVMKGTLETKSFGVFGTKQELTVGSASVEGKVGASLIQDGKLAPAITAKASAQAAVAEGKVTQTFGTKNFNTYSTASGKVLGAEAKAEASAGVITYKDDTGATKTAIGAKAEVGAEAYIAKGTVKSGFTFMGVKVDGGLTGKYGAVGAKAGGHVTTAELGGSIDLGLGLGVGLDVNIDFSGAKLVDPVKELRETVPLVDDVFGYFGF